jgi:hypothetical protein
MGLPRNIETSPTHNFPHQDDVLPPDEEQTVPALCKGTAMVYSLNSIFEHQVGYPGASGRKQAKRS